jgi:8-amino-7-oxononanoate synthase
MGFAIGSVESPIVPVTIGAADRTIAMWRALLEAGVYVNIVLPPACRGNACLLRTSYSAVHTNDELDRALAIFERVGRKLGLLDAPASVGARRVATRV